MAIIAKKTPTKAKRKEAEEETPASPSPSSPDALAELLLADPLANANCLPKLLALEAAPRDESSASTTAAACRALSLVFQAAGSRGELIEEEEEEQEEEGGEDNDGKREQERKNNASSVAAAERSYRRWLRARFSDHARRLRLVLSASSSHPRAQAAAARAALEASRSAETGKIDAGLLGSCLDALLLSDAASASASNSSFSSSSSSASSGGGGASAEAVAVLLSRARFADVRHCLLKSIGRCASALAASSSASSSPSSSVSAAAAAGGAAPVPPPPPREALEDAARTLVDVLVRVPSLPERRRRKNGDENGGGGRDKGEDDEDDDSLLSQSWCGAEEVGKAAAASGSSGSRERRKKKRMLEQQQQQQGLGGKTSPKSSAAGVSWALPREHRRASRLAWQRVLLLPSPRVLPADALSQALRALPGALPGMDRPALLCDALTDAVSGIGGGAEGKASSSSSSLSSTSSSSSAAAAAAAHATAVAALSALFELVVRHGLEYPDLYTRLYALLTPSSLTSRDRGAFTGLLDAALASRMVPAYSAASFAKKFARIALSAPPAAALLSLTFVSNVMKRHPATAVMLHRRGASAGKGKGKGKKKKTEEDDDDDDDDDEDDDDEQQQQQVIDPFDPKEADPAMTRAIESSLWEVPHCALRHSAPAVAAAARAILCDPGLVPAAAAASASTALSSAAAAAKRKRLLAAAASSEADPRPAAAATYGTMVAEALAKRVKRAPAVCGDGGGGGGGRQGQQWRRGSIGGGRDGDGDEGLMLFGGGAWAKAWKSNSGSSNGKVGDGFAAATALADEA